MEDNQPNKLTVKTVGAYELRDPIQNIDIGEEPVEVLETSFVSQMIGLKRLKVVSGQETQEYDPRESTTNPSVGEVLTAKDSEPTIRELNENAPANRKGRTPNQK